MKIKYKAGHESIIKCKDREGEIIKSKYDAYRLTIVETYNEPKVNKNKLGEHDKLIDYDDKVYCATSLFGNLYVRRDGIPSWTGNSSNHG
jgi:hypothetical protein